MKEEKAALIEEIGLHFESLYDIPPLASRIYATLILNGNEGFSFEELTELMQASKSSVSTSINLLLQLGKITYYTKPGDRKRYFKKEANYLKMRLEKYIKIIDREIQIFDKTFEYLKRSNPESYESGKDIKAAYHNYLERSKSLMLETIPQLESSTNQNN